MYIFVYYKANSTITSQNFIFTIHSTVIVQKNISFYPEKIMDR